MQGTLFEDVIDFLTNNPELDEEIENDFMDSVGVDDPNGNDTSAHQDS